MVYQDEFNLINNSEKGQVRLTGQEEEQQQ